jgi:hypothetical protein
MFVQEEQTAFDELQLLKSFNRLADPHYAFSIINILQSPNASDGRVMNPVLDTTCIRKWLFCFTHRVRVPTSDIRSFMARCEEFTVIVYQFYQDCVLKGQDKLEDGEALSKDCIDNFEHFRCDFNYYLQKVEEWRIGLDKRLHKVASGDQLLGTMLDLSSCQVKQFTQKSAQSLAKSD